MANHHDHEIEIEEIATPTWSKIVEPIVALAILWILYSAACQLFA